MMSIAHGTAMDEAAQGAVSKDRSLEANKPRPEYAKNDPAQLRRIAKAVRQGARGSGLDLDTMELTDQGFAPRRS